MSLPSVVLLLLVLVLVFFSFCIVLPLLLCVVSFSYNTALSCFLSPASSAWWGPCISCTTFDPFRRRRRRRRRRFQREKMFDASSFCKKLGNAVSRALFPLPSGEGERERERERETHRIFSGLVPVCAATSFSRSQMVSSSLHFTRIFFPRRSLGITSIT